MQHLLKPSHILHPQLTNQNSHRFSKIDHHRCKPILRSPRSQSFRPRDFCRAIPQYKSVREKFHLRTGRPQNDFNSTTRGNTPANIAICEALYLIDARRGAWTTKAQQDSAFTWLIRERELSSSLSKLHTAGTLRDLIGRTIRKSQRLSRGQKKGINDIFELGSDIFPNEFLQEIGHGRRGETEFYRQAPGARSAPPNVTNNNTYETNATKPDESESRLPATATSNSRVSWDGYSGLEKVDDQKLERKRLQQGLKPKREHSVLDEEDSDDLAVESGFPATLAGFQAPQGIRQPKAKRSRIASSGESDIAEPPVQAAKKLRPKRDEPGDDDDHDATFGSKLQAPYCEEETQTKLRHARCKCASKC